VRRLPRPLVTPERAGPRGDHHERTNDASNPALCHLAPILPPRVAPRRRPRWRPRARPPDGSSDNVPFGGCGCGAFNRIRSPSSVTSWRAGRDARRDERDTPLERDAPLERTASPGPQGLDRQRTTPSQEIATFTRFACKQAFGVSPCGTDVSVNGACQGTFPGSTAEPPPPPVWRAACIERPP